MALEYKDRVSDRSNTVGVGALTLSGTAPDGFRTFTAAGFTTGATVRYCITSGDSLQWEVGQGVWTTVGATLTRDKVYASSNAGALVSFSNTPLDVLCANTAADATRPVFRVYRNSLQTFPNAVFTKVQWNVVDFDTCGGFDITTNNRWTPTAPGYYQFNGHILGASGATGRCFCLLYKNGVGASTGNDNSPSSYRATVHDILYMNGTTDYIELFAYTLAGGVTSGGGPQDTFFSGALISPAP
jgi:hypothetical protein